MKKILPFLSILFLFCEAKAGHGNVIIQPVTLACYGDTGSLLAVFYGGGGNVTYQWSSGQTTPRASGLSAGTYTVIVSSDSGIASATGIINAPDSAINPRISAIQTSCYSSIGTVSVSPTGGNGNYTYMWNVPGVTSTIGHLGPGNYEVTVTDQKGCTAVASDSIKFPPIPLLNMTSVNPKCYGLSTGYIYAQVTGGTPGYNYVWAQSNVTNSVLSNLTLGQYSVTVTDGSGCTLTGTKSISQPDLLVCTGDSVVNIKCFGDSTSIHPSAKGGTKGYLFTGTTTGLIPADTFYTILVTDTNGCTAVGKFKVNGPASMLAANPVQNFGTHDVSIGAFGGWQPYKYKWLDITDSSSTRIVPGPGVYPFSVTDDSGCVYSNSIFVIYTNITIVCLADVKVYPIPANDFITVNVNQQIPGYTELVITDMTGRKPYYRNRIAVSGSCIIDVSNWPSGIFNLNLLQNNEVLQRQIIVAH